MTEKWQQRIKYALYAVLLLVALLLDTAVFTAINIRVIPTTMPIAVACIGLWEGAEKGGIYGVIGGCLWAWSAQLTMYGAWVIIAVTITGVGAGLCTQSFLLQSWKTIFAVSTVALLLTDGAYTCFLIMGRAVQPEAFFTVFLPEGILSLCFVVLFYPVSEYISRIGGFHG